ncbi:MAG: sulfatase-like hydrolase/transferase [Acidobacteriota bacterium]
MARPFRYTFILICVALATALAAAGGWRYARASAPVNGPIILISIDTLRADHLPVYGYRGVKTPAIDALAADGVVFERAYSHAPQTLPAHASLLSGRLPFETGVRDNVGFVVKAGERLLPQMLRDRGFATGGVVSTYLLRKETGVNQGFDFFDDEMPADSLELAIEPGHRDGAESEAIAERWLALQRSQRLFLFLHLNEPHAPYSPPAQYAEYSGYDGEIAYADEIVGRLIRYLKSHQLYDGSTIILLSDHGEGLGDHGEQTHGLFLYDEAIHVPLIVKQAGSTDGGRRIRDVVQHVDIAPTILALARAPIPGNLRGRSLKAILEGSGSLPAQAVYSEALYGRYHFGWSELTAVTDARYRYIQAPTAELYDLDRDPHERQNAADDVDGARAQESLRAALGRLVAGATIGAPGQVSAEERERLLALGYVSGRAAMTAAAAATLPDPKNTHAILETYRQAVGLAADRKWPQSIALLQRILRDDPGMLDAWEQLAASAMLAERYDQAIEAYTRVIELEPAGPGGYLGAGGALLKARRLDDARAHAELAVTVAGERDPRSRAAAHELLARIALARRDAESARREAALAREADPKLPLPAYVEARLLSEQGQHGDAFPLFEQAIAELTRSKGRTIANLHFHAAEALVHLERPADAEREFIEELEVFPQNTRARAGLATLYQANGQSEDVARVIDDLIAVSPTPDAYALAARLWTTFGNRQRADALRAQARRTFAAPPAPAGRAARK